MNHFKFLNKTIGREPVLQKTEFGISNMGKEKKKAITEGRRRMTQNSASVSYKM